MSNLGPVFLLSSLCFLPFLDFFCFSHSIMSNSGPVFLLSSLCFLLFWTFSASLTPLCPIQALFSRFPLFAFFSFGLFLLLSLLYVQFRPCFPAFLSLLSSLLDFFCFSHSFMSNSGPVFLLFSLCFLLFWTFSLFLLHYVQFNLWFFYNVCKLTGIVKFAVPFPLFIPRNFLSQSSITSTAIIG